MIHTKTETCFKINFSTLMGVVVGLLMISCSTPNNLPDEPSDLYYRFEKNEIIVDGKIGDWDSIQSIQISSEKNLWVDHTLPKENWQGPDDLSFRWKACHSAGKLFFLITVKDDTLSSFNDEYAWENDCVEIHLDHQGLKGERIIGIGEDNTLEDRYGKRLRGHEMQFLPSDPVKVFFDDSERAYYTDSAQTESFSKNWFGEVALAKTIDGYTMEIGFGIPNYYAQSGDKIGLEVAVCDNDGKGRKTLMTSTGYQGSFWVTMDEFHQTALK